MRTDQHAVTAGAAYLFDDSVLQIVERVFEVFGSSAEFCVDVGEDRFLVEVVADHVGDVCVDAFVVGDAGAGGVDQGHVAEAICVEKTWDAKERVGTEYKGVDEVVVDSSVDDVDPAKAGGGPHVDEAVVYEKIASFN